MSNDRNVLSPARLPSDDLTRPLTFVPAEDTQQLHLGLVGAATHTLLLSGNDTDGRFILLDSHMPPGGGPPPHRHDFEEALTVLEGELEVTFRGESQTVRVGETVNIPANAPHRVNNTTSEPVRFLCVRAPAGLDEFFLGVGIPVPTRTSAAPLPDEAELAEFQANVARWAPLARTELL